MTTVTTQTSDFDSTSPNSTLPRAAEEEMRSHHGSLRSKLVLSLAAVFLVFLTVDETVRLRVIEPEFAALEEAGAVRDANRVLAAMNAEVEHLSDIAKHWAARIDEGTATSVESKRPFAAATRSNGWASQTLSWAACREQDGSWKWLHRSQEGSPDTNEVETHLRSLVQLGVPSAKRTSSGMTRIGDHSLVMFAVVALDIAEQDQPNHQQDTLLGRYLVVARTIDEAMVTALRRQTQVEFSLQSPRTSDPSEKVVVWVADDSMLVVEVQLTGMNNQNLANVFVQFPRDITARSHRTTVLARNSFIFGSVAALLLLLLLLQRIVIGPLTAIREHSDRIAEEGLATEPLVLTGNDEIGQLAGAFDKMVARLSDTQNQLTQASRAAGRSQVASNVIHNVGNVLTNVNSLLDAAGGRVHGLRIGPLEKLASRLKQADAGDGLLAATPDYLEGLAGSLKSDQHSLSQLLATLNDNIRHIHDVIRAQRRHADQTIDSSTVKLKNVIDEAIACCRARLDQDSVSVSVSGKLSINVKSDRSLMLQTMINIIGNARHAMRDNDDQPRTLCIDVEPQGASVLIRFRDNGCGMSKETIGKVFDAHFTTRESGTGLGLHFCAITLKRLGGSIRATSEGPGLGSTFVIELPRRESKMIATALNPIPTTTINVGAPS